MTLLPAMVTDAELACAAAAGDRRAFAGIYDRYADRLYNFCIGMLADRDAAADCVQEVFCTAAAGLDQLHDPDKLRPWLYAIARNEALRCIRARRRELLSEEVPEMMSAEAGPESLAARNELAELIAEAAGGLSDRDRSVLELAYRHGLDGPELAEALEISPGHANKLVSRLRQTIEHSLGALLVARHAQHDPRSCAELQQILTGLDGRFTVLMRKRISRHIQSCPECERQRRKLVNPMALLGAMPVFIPAPPRLRQRTLNSIQLTAAATDIAQPTTTATRTRDVRAAQLIALFLGTLVASFGLTIACLHRHHIPVGLTESSTTPPASSPGTAPPSTAAPTPTNAAVPTAVSSHGAAPTLQPARAIDTAVSTVGDPTNAPTPAPPPTVPTFVMPPLPVPPQLPIISLPAPVTASPQGPSVHLAPLTPRAPTAPASTPTATQSRTQ
jgi:RNA polymerase sigma factor (sigma-70 family)